MQNIEIDIATDYRAIVNRKIYILGSESGIDFYNTILHPKFREALTAKTRLYINLDGASGYSTYFLKNTFGQLYKKYGSAVIDVIEFQSRKFNFIVEYIKSEIWQDSVIMPDEK